MKTAIDQVDAKQFTTFSHIYAEEQYRTQEGREDEQENEGQSIKVKCTKLEVELIHRPVVAECLIFLIYKPVTEKEGGDRWLSCFFWICLRWDRQYSVFVSVCVHVRAQDAIMHDMLRVFF